VKNTDTPPRLPLRILRIFIRTDLLDEVTGDLKELYDMSRLTRSRFICRLIIWYEVIHYLRPFALRKTKFIFVNPYCMYKSYFKTSFRSMFKNKLHTFINITGLSVAMATVLIIVMWVGNELAYEKNFKNYQRIGQVLQNVTNNGYVQTWNSIPYPLADEVRKNYGSDFVHVVLTSGKYPHLLASETKKLNKSGLYAEPDFTTMLTLSMLAGSADAIKDPSSVLLSASTAKAYFGEADPIGQIMTIDREFTVKVAGVYEDIPTNSIFSDMHFIAAWDLLFNGTGWIKHMEDPWRPNAFSLYVQLADHATFEEASAKIKDAKLKKVSEALAKKKPELFIHPMSQWHLYDKFENGKLAGGRIQYVWLFGIVGSFVLLMACINFMNLSTAQSEKRAKEVGIRKAIGSIRSQLVAQFFSESILTAFFSLALALLLMQLMMPFFNAVAGKNMSMQWDNVLWWLIGIIFTLVIGLIAGSYPALYLSSISAGKAIKGVHKGGHHAIPRKVLVTVQFTVSVVLMVGTAVVFLQIKHAKDRPIGYSANGLIAVPPMSPEIHKHFDVVKSELVKSGAIVSMAEAVSPTTEQWSSSSQFDWRGKDPDLSVDFPTYGVSHDYGETIGWEIKGGRDFSRDRLSDSTALILNESAVAYMGLKNPIGETIRWGGQAFEVIGVIRDIVVRSPYEPVSPTFYFLSTSEENFLLMRINPASATTAALDKIETVCKKYNADVPFTYEFTDEAYARKFGNEERVGTLATIFATLAILISCLGIFGLSSFMAEQRTKEIGVRKVLGASLFDLWRLMSKDFVLLVLISCVIAVPTAYTILSSWLKNFQYRLGIPWWTFLLATVGTLFITMLTVSWHTISVARVNPVKSLRAE
jgi:putative ABC transport system permease protein